MELHPLAITGLTSGLSVETDEHAIGGAGDDALVGGRVDYDANGLIDKN